jgi:enterobacteria phage integrase
MKCDLPYVDGFRDRHGKARYYFRRKGKRIVLPGPPGSPEFVAAYNAALEAKPKILQPNSKEGSFGALRVLYLGSAEFENLAKSTRDRWRYVLDQICLRQNKSGIGIVADNPVAALERRHILDWRDAIKKTPGAANTMLRVLKTWLTFSVDRNFRKDNPALGIKELKGGRYRAWTDDELQAFEEKWAVGTIERTTFALALYTGQRRGDLARLKWSMIAGDVLMVRQSKTGTDMAIPLHPSLKAALAAVKPRSEKAILVNASRNPFHPVHLGHTMAAAIDDAGLPSDCVLHGLRKTTARKLAELGQRARVLTGHLSADMEREYERDADQKKMAKAAVLAWSKEGKHKKKKV